MKVELAGFNVDVLALEEIRKGKKIILTPESIAAAYARISRSKNPIKKLRETSIKEIEKARKSCDKIVHEYGHATIAEHAVFNIDIINVSRLLVNFIENFRLNSYTEKSMRYVLFKKDFLLPQEIKNSPFIEEYLGFMNECFNLYEKAFKIHLPIVKKKFPNIKDERKLEGIAKEDDRYCLPLSTFTQLGMTINARNIEKMISKANSSSLHETKELGQNLEKILVKIVPSLIKYTKATKYYKDTRENLEELSESIETTFNIKTKNEGIKLIDYTKNADDKLIAHLLSSNSNMSFEKCLGIAENLSEKDRKDIVMTSLKDLKVNDAVLREFENIHFSYEINISEAGYAQFKRHRIQTWNKKPYSIDYGFTLPESIYEIGLDREYKEKIERACNIFRKLKKELSREVAAYVLPLANNTCVLSTINLRELYHISRLRQKLTAQWDIRDKANKMVELAKEVAPLGTMLLGGKDKFGEIREKTYRD